MKRAFLNGCSVLVMVMGLATAAQAAGSTGIVRSAQERLNQLGYYTGGVDGVVGEQTRHAILDFQRRNGLAQTGSLTPETYGLLGGQYDGRYSANYSYHYDDNRARYHADYKRPYYYYGDRYARADYWIPGTAWNGINAQALPVRYGQLVISQDRTGGTNNYAVMLNGQPVLYANNQPGALRVSKTYQLGGEDAVIFTAYDGTGGCSYRNYLVSVKGDGSTSPAQAIGNCTGNYEARVDGNMLYVSFDNGGSVYGRSDVWRYSNSTVGRINETLARL